MRQIRTLKHRPGSRSGQEPPLPADARDPDIVRAHRNRTPGRPLPCRSYAARRARPGAMTIRISNRSLAS